jgi:hypothetical protein
MGPGHLPIRSRPPDAIAVQGHVVAVLHPSVHLVRFAKHAAQPVRPDTTPFDSLPLNIWPPGTWSIRTDMNDDEMERPSQFFEGSDQRVRV